MKQDLLKNILECFSKHVADSPLKKVGNDFYMSYDDIEIKNNEKGGIDISFIWRREVIFFCEINHARIENNINLHIHTTGMQKYTLS